MKKILILLFFIFLKLHSFSQDVVVDNTFGELGMVTTPNARMIIKTTKTIDDNLICIGYNIEDFGVTHIVIAKYNSSGVLDTSFGSDGLVSTNLTYSEYPYDILIQPDNKIVILGSYKLEPSPNGPGGNQTLIIRYLPDGNLDNSFAVNGILIIDEFIGVPFIKANNIDLLTNAQFLISGNCKSGIETHAFIAKLNTDGTLDTNYGNDGLILFDDPNFRFNSSHLLVNNNEEIFICGQDATTYNTKLALVKMDINGSYQNSFANNGKFIYNHVEYDQPREIENFTRVIELESNKILITGYSYTRLIMQLNADGSFDSGFGDNGILIHSYTNSIEIQNDGKILIVGIMGPYEESYFSLSRLNTDGSFDSSFNSNNTFDLDISTGTDYINSQILQENGKLIIGGGSQVFTTNTTSELNFTLLRLDLGNNLSIEETNFSENEISIFPNPVSNQLNISVSNDITINEIEINNLLGTKIKTLTTNFNPLDLSGFNNGMYFLKFNTNKGILQKKFIVNN